jgi:acylphosphatase
MQDRPTTIARRCLVAGRVQGVFYRASTREKALELGCRGYARNLADGRVEVLILGEPAAVHALIEWLWRGPPAAHVTGVEVQEIDPQELHPEPVGFSTGRDR